MGEWISCCWNDYKGYHMVAFFMGFLLDLLLGDPQGLPHPVRFMGWWINTVENGLQRLLQKGQEKGKKRNPAKEVRAGVVLVVLVTGGTVLVGAALFFGAYGIHPYVGILVETIMTWQILAVKSLKTESMKVYRSLKEEGLKEAQKAVSMIVGRDTKVLDETGVIKATVETVAENTSDGVIAPMLYAAVGGPVFGLFYKAVNTMDSMVGYKNDRYLYLGRAAAKLDDLVNYIPARISAYCMILAAAMGGKCFDSVRAYRIYKRDNRKHASPNSAQTESVCAGALGICLAGDASYFGRIVKKPYIGDACREVECEDIKRANRLLYFTAWIGELLCLMVLVAVTVKIGGR